MLNELTKTVVFAACVATFVIYSFTVRAESGMCQTVRERHPSLISTFCRDSEPPPEMENPSLSDDDDDDEEEDDVVAPTPLQRNQAIAREPAAPGCTATGLYPYAGNCALDEMDHQIDKAIPLGRLR
jgi:hypothetical protein